MPITKKQANKIGQEFIYNGNTGVWCCFEEGDVIVRDTEKWPQTRNGNLNFVRVSDGQSQILSLNQVDLKEAHTMGITREQFNTPNTFFKVVSNKDWSKAYDIGDILAKHSDDGTEEPRFARVADGKRGWFPMAYVEVTTERLAGVVSKTEPVAEKKALTLEEYNTPGAVFKIVGNADDFHCFPISTLVKADGYGYCESSFYFFKAIEDARQQSVLANDVVLHSAPEAKATTTNLRSEFRCESDDGSRLVIANPRRDYVRVVAYPIGGAFTSVHLKTAEAIEFAHAILKAAEGPPKPKVNPDNYDCKVGPELFTVAHQVAMRWPHLIDKVGAISVRMNTRYAGPEIYVPTSKAQRAITLDQIRAYPMRKLRDLEYVISNFFLYD